MKKILMTICLIGGLAMLWSCSDDKDSYPVPSDIENLKATPAPGPPLPMKTYIMYR